MRTNRSRRRNAAPSIGAALLIVAACHRHDPATMPKLDAPTDAAAASNADDVEVEIDLAPHGMAAFVRAPEAAAVRATAGEVEITAGPDYHLLVGRGDVDILGEQARIVRAFGDEFRRFLRDDGATLVYETGGDAEQRYHLFMSARAGDEAYHCRTPPDGLPSRDAVDHLVKVCADVRFTARAQVPQAG